MPPQEGAPGAMFLKSAPPAGPKVRVQPDTLALTNGEEKENDQTDHNSVGTNDRITSKAYEEAAMDALVSRNSKRAASRAASKNNDAKTVLKKAISSSCIQSASDLGPQDDSKQAMLDILLEPQGQKRS